MDSTTSNSKIETDEDDSNICPICLDQWTSQGEHQLCSLNCGHFFGLSCIRRTLISQSRGGKHCPLCNIQAKEKDIRRHYSLKTLAVRDSTKEQTLNEQLKQERADRITADLLVGQLRVEIKNLQQQLLTVKSSSSSGSNYQATSTTSIEQMNKSIRVDDIKENQSSHVCLSVPMNKTRTGTWISKEQGAVVATYVSDIKKYKLVSVHPEYPHREQVPSGGLGQSMPIRDISVDGNSSFCYGGLLASASLDCSIKLNSCSNLNEIQTVQLPEPVWSVAFLGSQNLLAGTTKGRIYQIDIRNTSKPVSVLTSGVNEPIHSICKLNDNDACVASFTKLLYISGERNSIQFVNGLSPRSIGSQYSSMVVTSEGELAISIREQNNSFVDVGMVKFYQDIEEADFKLVAKFSGYHHIPSGKIACFNSNNVLVPDETSKSCISYPTGQKLGLGDQVISSTSYCGIPTLSMLISTDSVEFVPISSNFI